MRVAQRMVTRNYMNSLNTSMSKRAETFERQTSGLKFTKLSQNVSDGMRAMRVQEERQRCQHQLETVESIQLEFNSVDSNMESIDDILQSVQEQVLKAMSDSYGDVSREVLSQQIGSIKGQIIQFANAQFGGKFLFSGTNNAEAPFQVDDVTGKLQFNGINVDEITKTGGKYYYFDGVSNVEVPDSGDIYMDIGLGLNMNNATPDPRSAFKVSFSGLELLGFGASVAGEKYGTPVESNVYGVLEQLEKAVADGDKHAMDDLHKQLVSLNDKMRMQRTELGSRMNFLDRTEERLTNDIDNLSEMESNLITADPAEEAINMKMAEYVWLATLQLGAQILPQSLLDFIR